MKVFLPTTLLFLLLTLALQSRSQLMKTLDDAHLLAENDSLLFRGKPLKNLLKEIGPEIEWVSVAERKNYYWNVTWIYFRFKIREADKPDCKSRAQPRIRVFFREDFEWKKSGPDFTKWTKDDAERLGNLTIAFIKVYGTGQETFAAWNL